MGKYRVLLSLILCSVIGFRPLLAQAPTGILTGAVTDESGAVVPGAEISLMNEATQNSRRTLANGEGFFSLTALPAATYTLQVEKTGFAVWKRTGIVIRVADHINVPEIILRVGSADESITVSASPVGITPVNSGEKASVISGKEIENLAIVGRSAIELLKILPGVVYRGEGFPGETISFGEGPGQYHVAGGRGDSGVAILSDGADVIDPSCDCGTAVTPNVDLVSEVKIQVANFGADQAKGPVVFQSVSKAGTSEFHGEGYLYWRTDAFNSQDWRANYFGSPKPEERYYFPGFNLGGPLIKGRDNAFFFAGFEWMGQNFTAGDIPAVVPTERMRQGDFTEICLEGMRLKGYNECPANDFWGNWTDPGFEGLENGVIDPNLFDPGGKALIHLYPFPNRDPAAADGWNYVSNIVKPLNRDQELVRLDWKLTENLRLHTRFNHERERGIYPYALNMTFVDYQHVPYPTRTIGNPHTLSTSTSLVHVIGANSTNEVLFALTDWGGSYQLEDPAVVASRATGYPYHGLFDNHLDIIPNVTGWGNGLASFMQQGGILDPGLFVKKTLVSSEDNFTRVLNTHTLKLGFRWAFVADQGSLADYDQGMLATSSWGENGTGNAYADLLLGRISSFLQVTTNPVAYLRRNEVSAFLHDSWKVARNLTLDFGLRVEHNGFFYDKKGRLSGFDPARYDPEAPLEELSGLVAPYRGDDVPRSVWESPFLMISPRVGFAWDLSGRGTTVLRGGGGAYRYHGFGGLSGFGLANPPLQLHSIQCCGFFLDEIDRLDPGLQRSDINVLELHNDAYPATYSFSLTLSQRFPGDMFGEISYVGNSSSHQLYGRGLNVIPEGTMPVGSDNTEDYLPYGSFAWINSWGHMLSQNYNALQFTLNRQTGGLNFSLGYSFGKAMGIGGSEWEIPNVFDLRSRNYGPLPYDRTHSLSVAYNWMLPGEVRQPLLGALLNGWQLTGITQFQSGAPIRSLFLAGTTSDGVAAADAIDITGTPNTTSQPFLICDPREGILNGEWFNPHCFEAPTIGHNGHYAWPYFKGPAFQNHDLSIFKNWRMGTAEDRKLQLRVSFYNILNHPLPYFSGQGLTLDFTDGVITEDTIERDNVGRTSLKKGRRLMQFAIKYIF